MLTHKFGNANLTGGIAVWVGTKNSLSRYIAAVSMAVLTVNKDDIVLLLN